MQRPVRTAAVMAALALAACTSNAESPPGSPSATSAVVAGTTTVPITAPTSTGAATSVPTSGPTGTTSPGPAPPPGFVAFIKGHENHSLFTIGTDGTGQRRLFSTGDESWSEAAQLFVDGVPVAGRGRLPATFTRDGKKVAQLDPDPPDEVVDTQWSRDGTRIVGSSFPHTTPPVHGLVAFNVSGKPDLVTLTSNARRVGEIAVAYSPDGSKILFFRTGPDGDTDVPVDLYVIDADGGAPVRLNPPGVGAAWNDTPFLGSASWSPDGRRVAFVGTTGFDIHGDRGWAVYVVGADGSNPKMITPPASTFDAVWSPDGEWIAFDMPNEGSRDLFVVHPDGTGLRAVTSAATDGLFSFGPKWSPDGSWLLFIRGPSEFDDVDLWMSDVEGTNLVQLTHRPAFYSFYSWNT